MQDRKVTLIVTEEVTILRTQKNPDSKELVVILDCPFEELSQDLQRRVTTVCQSELADDIRNGWNLSFASEAVTY